MLRTALTALFSTALAAATLLVPGGAPASAQTFGYSISNSGPLANHLFQIELTTGVSADLGLVNFWDAEGMAATGSTLLAIGGSESELWDVTAPPGALIGATGFREGLDAGLAVDPTTGYAYNINGGFGGSILYRVNPLSGSTSEIGSSSIYADSLGINSLGEAFALDVFNTNSLYRVNLSTGNLALVGALNVAGLDFDQTGADFDALDRLWVIDDDGLIFQVNTATGAATQIAQTTLNGSPVTGFEGLAIVKTNNIPEPGTLALLGLPLLPYLIVARSRRRNAS